MRGHDDIAACVPQFETKVDVTERDRKGDFVEAAEGKKQSARGRHAGCADRARRMRDLEEIGIARIAVQPVGEGGARAEMDTEHEAGVLDNSARPQQRRADGANGVVAMARKHFLQPRIVARLDVVAQEA